MENYAHPVNHSFGYSRLAQIGLHEFRGALLHVRLDILNPSTAQIIHHSDFRAASDERIHNPGTDKRSSAGDKYFAILPIHSLVSSICCMASQIRRVLTNENNSTCWMQSPTRRDKIK